jgi:lipopolysaccharide/colanic/teichoic acid biosynthesis glycosyltransferase
MRRSKRVVDLVLAVIGLILFGPLLLLIAIAIRFDDPGPVFFAHTRVGRDGRCFRMWKFRTMKTGAERCGGSLTIHADPRITRVGRVLRVYKLDELPQLLNVVIGNMSLVGPRPEAPEFVNLHDRMQCRVLKLMPGITDPAAIHYSDLPTLLAHATDPKAFYLEEIRPDKIRRHLEYAAWATTWTDLRIVLQTVGCIVDLLRSRRGASSPMPGARTG